MRLQVSVALEKMRKQSYRLRGGGIRDVAICLGESLQRTYLRPSTISLIGAWSMCDALDKACAPGARANASVESQLVCHDLQNQRTILRCERMTRAAVTSVLHVRSLATEARIARIRLLCQLLRAPSHHPHRRGLVHQYNAIREVERSGRAGNVKNDHTDVLILRYRWCMCVLKDLQRYDTCHPVQVDAESARRTGAPLGPVLWLDTVRSLLDKETAAARLPGLEGQLKALQARLDSAAWADERDLLQKEVLTKESLTDVCQWYTIGPDSRLIFLTRPRSRANHIRVRAHGGSYYLFGHAHYRKACPWCTYPTVVIPRKSP